MSAPPAIHGGSISCYPRIKLIVWRSKWGFWFRFHQHHLLVLGVQLSFLAGSEHPVLVSAGKQSIRLAFYNHATAIVGFEDEAVALWFYGEGERFFLLWRLYFLPYLFLSFAAASWADRSLSFFPTWCRTFDNRLAAFG